MQDKTNKREMLSSSVMFGVLRRGAAWFLQRRRPPPDDATPPPPSAATACQVLRLSVVDDDLLLIAIPGQGIGLFRAVAEGGPDWLASCSDAEAPMVCLRLLERCLPPAAVCPRDLGLPHVIITRPNGTKEFFGPRDDLTSVLRRTDAVQ